MILLAMTAIYRLQDILSSSFPFWTHSLYLHLIKLNNPTPEPAYQIHLVSDRGYELHKDSGCLCFNQHPQSISAKPIVLSHPWLSIPEPPGIVRSVHSEVCCLKVCQGRSELLVKKISYFSLPYNIIYHIHSQTACVTLPSTYVELL